MTEKEKDNFVSGKYLICLMDFKIFKKSQSYWLEYLGDNVYIGRSDNILNEKVTIEPFQLDYFIESDKFDNDTFELLNNLSYTSRTFGLVEKEDNVQYCARLAKIAFDELYEILNTKYKTNEVELQDIKKGDVLVNGPILIIVDHLGTFENRPIIYSWYFADSQKFYGMGPSEPDRWEAEGFTPATKEQRDLLFQKMKDAGYEWDEDKKELKKL